MESKTDRIIHIRPPTQSTTPGTGITRLATSTAAVARDLDASSTGAMFGKRIRLYNEDATDSIWIAFSLTGATSVDKTATAGTTVAGGTLASNGFKLPPLGTIEVRLSKGKHKYIHLQSSANTPILCIYPLSAGVLGA